MAKPVKLPTPEYMHKMQAKSEVMMAAFIKLDQVLEQLQTTAFEQLNAQGLKPDQPEGKEALRRYYMALDPLLPVFFAAVQAQHQIEVIELKITKHCNAWLEDSKLLQKKGVFTVLAEIQDYVEQERKPVFELLEQLKEHMLKLQAATYQPFQNLAQTYLDAYDSMDEVLHDYTLLNVIGTEDEVGDLQYDPALMLFD